MHAAWSLRKLDGHPQGPLQAGLRVGHLDYRLARRRLRIPKGLRMGRDRTRGDAGGFENAGLMVRALALEVRLEQRHQSIVVFDPDAVVLKARIARQIPDAEEIAKAQP